MHFSIQHSDRNITSYKFGTTWFRVNNDRVSFLDELFLYAGNQAKLVWKPWSAGTNVSWHVTMSKHMPEHENNKCSFCSDVITKECVCGLAPQGHIDNTDKKSGSKLVCLIWVTRFRICRENSKTWNTGWQKTESEMWTDVKLQASTHIHQSTWTQGNAGIL